MYRWVHSEKARYYQADLVKDLFGDWTLVTVWGDIGSGGGAMRMKCVPSYEAGLERIRTIDRQRRQHGYRNVAEE